jgi:hypothetical protein
MGQDKQIIQPLLSAVRAPFNRRTLMKGAATGAAGLAGGTALFSTGCGAGKESAAR